MLKISRDGPQWYCDACQTPIIVVEEAWAVWRPTTGPDDTSDMLIVHEGCHASEFVKTLLPHQRCKRRLAAVLDLAAEALGR
jgi:hypothetical protein